MEVSIMSNRTDRIVKGQELPLLVQSEDTSRSTLLVDSKDRTSGSLCNFRASFRSRLTRPRYIKLRKCILPKVPNVNPNNYTLQIKHALGTTASFNLTPGIYNTTTLSNELTSKINTAYVTAGIVDTVTVSFDSITKTFSISSDLGLNFFIVNTCSFIQYGEYLAPFESEPLANAPSKNVIYSGLAAMLYSRYLTISSHALNQYAFATSQTSRATQPTQLLGIVDLAELYTFSDYDISTPFSGLYKTLETDGCVISVLNTQRSLNEEVDIAVFDEYGLSLDLSLNYGGVYPTSSLGLVFVFDCTF